MTDRPTVLISINTSWNIYNFRTGLVRALKAAGYRVVSAAPEDAYTPRLATLVDAHYRLPMQNAGTSAWHDFLLFLRYVRLLRTIRPTVMLTYTIKPNIYGALAAQWLGIPTIANVSGLGTAFIRDGWLTRIAKLLYRLAFRRIFRVFFQNAEDRNLFLQMGLVTAERSVSIPGSGVDLVYFSPTYAEKADASRTEVRFVLIARLLWDKGIGEYVDAARFIKATYPNARFSLVGQRGVDNKTAIADTVLDRWIAEGVVEYLGESDDIRSVLAQHDCVVLPSYREGLSRVLLEAAAMGKPLIATDVPGCREVVDTSSNGFLCRPHDAASLADAIAAFMACTPEERHRMGQQSRTKAEREFDEQQVFGAYLAAIADSLTHTR